MPFIVRWPGKTPADSKNDELVELTDLLATCAAITDQKLAAGAGEDSVNILPALLGQKSDQPLRDYAVHHSLWGHFAIRQGPWKMVPKRGSGGFTNAREVKPAKGEPMGQLYNLKADPSETKNVWNEHPEVVERLSVILEKVQAQDK